MPAAPSSELRRQLQWLMTFRVVITTTLLVCTFVIELLFRPLLPLLPHAGLSATGGGRGDHHRLRLPDRRGAEPVLLPVPAGDRGGVHPPAAAGRVRRRADVVVPLCLARP